MVKVEKKPSRKGIRKPISCKEPIQCPHVHFRHDVPDRRGIARDKHINIIATPRGYCWEDVKKDEDDKAHSPPKKTPTTPKRVSCKKYANKYDRAYIHNFLAEVWTFLCPEMADQLKAMLMNEFSMSEKDAKDFISKQREVNILNSSTVSLYKKPRETGDGKTVLDSIIKLRTPNKTYCDKFPKSTIGIRNSWIKDLSDLISEKMADYVLETMTADRTERQQEIAQTILNCFNTMLEQKASLSKPKTPTHKTMALVADRLSLWLDKNVHMSKENSERLKDIEEAEEEKKKGGDWRKRLEEKKQRREEKKRPSKSKREKQLEDEEGTGLQEPIQTPGQPAVTGGADESQEEEERVKADGLPQAQQPLSSGDPTTEREGDLEMGEEGYESELEDEEEGDESELEDRPPPDAQPPPDLPSDAQPPPDLPPDAQPPPDLPPDAQPPPDLPPDVQPPPDLPPDAQPQPPLTDSSAEGKGGEDQLKPKGEQGGEGGQSESTQGASPVDGEPGGKVESGKQPGDEGGEDGAASKDDGQPQLRSALPPTGITTEDEIKQGGEVEDKPQTGEGAQSGEAEPPKNEGESGGDDPLKSETDGGTIQAPPETELPASMEESTEGKEQSEITGDDLPASETAQPSGASEAGGESGLEGDGGPPSSATEQQPTSDYATEEEFKSEKGGDEAEPIPSSGDTAVDSVPTQEGGDDRKSEDGLIPGGDSSATSSGVPQQGPTLTTPSSEQIREKDLIKSIASLIAETPIEESPRQEAIKDVLGKQLEKELGDDASDITKRVSAQVATWIDKMVDQVETEYGDRDRKSLLRMGSVPQDSDVGSGKVPPVSQKPKGRIFVVKKVDDRQGYNVDLISNTRAYDRIRLARGRPLAKVEVPNPGAALEPAEVQNWVEWASEVSEMAHSWAKWIEDTVQEAQRRGEMLRKDDSPEKRTEWEAFRDKKARGAQQWRKTKKEVDRSAELWNRKGMKTRELRKTAQ